MAEPERRVAVVTDSTANLPGSVAASRGIRVVPLQVIVGARAYDDGVDPEASPTNIAAALRAHEQVSTSRPSPQLMLEAYRQAAEGGAEEVVSVHLSGEVSATYESALLAARQSPVPVHAVDTRQVGPGVGYAAVAAAEVAAAGGSAPEVADAARRRARGVVSLFYVDTLDYLRRGGRVGAASALVGTALSVKPLLQIENGRICPLERVRTSARALARLEERAVEAARGREVAATVCHLDSEPAAESLAAALTTKLGDRLAAGLTGWGIDVVEVPAVLGAHVGPGLVGVVVAPT